MGKFKFSILSEFPTNSKFPKVSYFTSFRSYAMVASTKCIARWCHTGGDCYTVELPLSRHDRDNDKLGVKCLDSMMLGVKWFITDPKFQRTITSLEYIKKFGTTKIKLKQRDGYRELIKITCYDAKTHQRVAEWTRELPYELENFNRDDYFETRRPNDNQRVIKGFGHRDSSGSLIVA